MTTTPTMRYICGLSTWLESHRPTDRQHQLSHLNSERHLSLQIRLCEPWAFSNRNNHQQHRGKLGCVEPVDHRDDHLHRVCPDRSHSLLTASNSNREFLAHAVFLDDSSSPTEPPCSSVLQVCALWDSGSNTCLITPNNVKPHWHWVSRKTQDHRC